jgi:hypothetical protein
VEAPGVGDLAHVQRLPARQCRGLAQLMGRSLSYGTRHRVADQVLDHLDVGRRLRVDGRAAEPPVHQPEALRVAAEHLHEAAVEPGQREQFRAGLLGR